MAIKYLLECSCGKKVPVASSQADQTVRCSCGQELQVPTLLKLRQFESIEEAPRRADNPGNWGAVQKLMTICVLMLLFAVGWLIYVVGFTQPPTPKEFSPDERVEKVVADMNLLDTFKLWGALRSDIRMKRDVDQYCEAATKAYRVRLSVALVLLIAALATTIMTLIFTRRVASRNRSVGQS